ncbi:MAG: serine/threonine protein kinase [Anaerolineales bacterium]|nr:serine/threonine protein kinase [Anaerolineales bacterium]
MEKGALLNDRYVLERPLASGGMAHVWLGRDQLLGRTVAIKILREEYTRKPDFQERFRREAQAIARLSHPNLVTVYDFGTHGGQFFMIMEYVEGEDLKSFLRHSREQPLEAWVDIAIQVCEGLGLAHRAGVVHCDVKPQNVLLASDLLAKIADFGIARATAAKDIAADSNGTRPLEDETIWGSPQYVSPEQAAGETLTPASDIYSAGVMLFEMLTGRLPFPGKDPRTLALQHQREPAPSPRLLNPAIPAELEGIVLRALAKDPARRYRNGDQMARVLKAYLEGNTAPLPGDETAPQTEEAQGEETDWAAIGMGFLSLISVGGLIPLWVYVFFLYNPPGR